MTMADELSPEQLDFVTYRATTDRVILGRGPRAALTLVLTTSR